MRRFLLCFTLLGLLACQKTTNSSANNSVLDQGGTSSGGPAAQIDLVHCHSHGHHLIVDIFLGQGLRLISGEWQNAQDSVSIKYPSDDSDLDWSGFFDDQPISNNGTVTQLEMSNGSTQILLNTEGILGADMPLNNISAILTMNGESRSLSCTMYPIWGVWKPCGDGWRSIEDLPKIDKQLCVPKENSINHAAVGSMTIWRDKS